MQEFHSCQPKKVLLIDDNAADAAQLCSKLSVSPSFYTTHVDSAERALATLRIRKFAIVLLSCSLQDENAQELLATIKQWGLLHETAVVVIGDEEHDEIAEQFILGGALAFMLKTELNNKLLRRISLSAEIYLDHEAKCRVDQHLVDYLTTHDSLTGLWNRAAFEEEIKTRLGLNRTEEHIAVIIVDIDDFCTVNECLGMAVGDNILKNCGQVLRKLANNNCKTARLCDDQFIIACFCDGAGREFPCFIDSVLEMLSAGIKEMALESPLAFSTGATTSVTGGGDYDTWIQQAMMALEEAKKVAGNSTVWFAQEMQRQIEARQNMENGIRYHLGQAGFKLVYQPIYDNGGKMVGVETLVRWPGDSNFGHYYPNEFIPVAESCQLINPLGEWIIKSALQAYSEQLINLNDQEYISLNISPVQLKSGQVAGIVKKWSNHYQLDPNLIVVEITETALLAEHPAVSEQIEAFSKFGVKIALDDFGTGYSSISHLLNYPIDLVKLDRSVVPKSSVDLKHIAVLRGLIDMCHSLGITAVVEGIENKWQAALCKSFSADKMQGYYFAEPMDMEAIVAFD